jgi:DNA (cytosine-5)-methyltransferase 1
MAKSDSGRVVIEVDAELKSRLHTELSSSGMNMKEWFTQRAKAFLAESENGLLAEPQATYGMESRSDLLEPLLRADRCVASGVASVISLFSGCGGMDLGFRGGFQFMGADYPKHPFKVIWANDFNKAACKTYAANLGHPIKVGDVWDHLDSLPEYADVVIGGFPCQDISVNGKRAGVAGKRSGLYRAMVETVRRTRPKIFVAENVKGLLMEYNRDSLHQVYHDFSALGYRVEYRLYRTADYGVPQLRERVFIVGTRPDVGNFVTPQPTHGKLDWVSAEQAIGDLETRKKDAEFSHIWSLAQKSPEQGNRRLKAERPGHTIRAECHGNIQFHYRLPRRISMREAARIQSFPDSFKFHAGLRETERQIGNAVPPVMAWHIANAVAKALGLPVQRLVLPMINRGKDDRKATNLELESLLV